MVYLASQVAICYHSGMSNLPNYDNWLEAPYQAGQDSHECPECGECSVKSDKNSAECSECGWYDEPDWDSIAEDRAEAREYDRDDEW